jgi:Mor family transcriptional regulator
MPAQRKWTQVLHVAKRECGLDDEVYRLEQLELLIGKENDKKVVDFFEGASIYFPKSIGLAEQHAQIYAELRRGAAYQDAALKYGYTWAGRMIVKIVFLNRAQIAKR